MKKKAKFTSPLNFGTLILLFIVIFSSGCTRSYFVHIPDPPLPPDTTAVSHMMEAMQTNDSLNRNIENDYPDSALPFDTLNYTKLTAINPRNMDLVALSEKIPDPPLPPDTTDFNLIKNGKRNQIDFYYLVNKDLKGRENIEAKIIDNNGNVKSTSRQTGGGLTFIEADSKIFAKVSFSFKADKDYVDVYRILLPHYYKGKKYMISIWDRADK